MMRNSKGWEPFVYQIGDKWYPKITRRLGPITLRRNVFYYPYLGEVSFFYGGEPRGFSMRETAEEGARLAARILNKSKDAPKLIRVEDADEV